MTIPDLTPAERRVFAAAYANPGACLSELAAMLTVARCAVARCVIRLERVGLLTSELETLPAERGARVPPLRLRTVRPAEWTVAP